MLYNVVLVSAIQQCVNQLCVCVCAQSLSHVQLFAAPWTVTHQASLSMEFFRHKYRSGLPFPPPRDLSDPRIEIASLSSLALADRFFTTSTT